MAEMIAIAAFKVQYPLEAPFKALKSRIQRRKTVRELASLSLDRLDDIGLDPKHVSKFWKY